jgi:hypothetical protein
MVPCSSEALQFRDRIGDLLDVSLEAIDPRLPMKPFDSPPGAVEAVAGPQIAGVLLRVSVRDQSSG